MPAAHVARLALGYTAMLLHGLQHAALLQRPEVRAALARQVRLSGVQALPLVALAAVAFGAIVPPAALDLAGVDNETVMKTVVWGGIRELGPLAAALLLVARSAIAMAAEIALMQLRQHAGDGLPQHMWVDAAHEDEVVLPRVLGLAAAGALLVAYFQVLALAAALGASALLLGTPLAGEADQFLANGQWWDIPLAVAKGALFGAGIGVVACYHGLRAGPRIAAIPKAASAACLGALACVFGIDLMALLLRFL